MAQTQEKKDPLSATERAEAMLDHFGRNLGLFVASTGKRVQLAATGRRKSEPGAQPEGEQPGSAHAEEGNQEPMERADAMVEQMEQRLSYFTQRASLGIQKTAARLREEVEDMWAEAQHIHQQPRH